MSDHLNYCNIIGESPDVSTNDWDDVTYVVNIEEKNGDELLIELYRERPFLYDKSNANFKNCLMKQNAWIEISKIMIQTNCGDVYTPSYCQKRCTSLRDQYSREKRKAETESKSGSAAAKVTRFPFFSQLKFLDHVVKRRRSYTNCTNPEPSTSVDEDSNTYESQSIANKSSKSQSQSQPQPGTLEEDSNAYDSQSVANEDNESVKQQKNFNKKNVVPKMKKQKVNETKELEQTLVQMSHRILSYIEKKGSTSDDSFMEFIKIQFNSIPEKEKHIRRKMIMDALTAPLPEKTHQKDCKCNILFKTLLINTLSH